MRKGVKVALLIPVGLAAIALFGFIVMSLWNWLAPAVFNVRTITFWQALGLLVLSRILVGGLGGGHGDDKHRRRSMMDRWEQMTPEEREAFRQGLRDRGESPDPASPL
ncbi:MAG: hypothetical protein ABSF54_04800 [Bryobacteraceae bacterium]|jgi:hypothetical protein